MNVGFIRPQKCIKIAWLCSTWAWWRSTNAYSTALTSGSLERRTEEIGLSCDETRPLWKWILWFYNTQKPITRFLFLLINGTAQLIAHSRWENTQVSPRLQERLEQMEKTFSHEPLVPCNYQVRILWGSYTERHLKAHFMWGSWEHVGNSFALWITSIILVHSRTTWDQAKKHSETWPQK